MPATKIAVPELGALPTSFYRATLAGIAALIYLLVNKISLPRKEDLPTLGIIATLISFVFPIPIAIAMNDLPSSHGGIVLGISPLLTALFATLRFGERLSRAFWITALIGNGFVLLLSIKQSSGGLQASDLTLIFAVVTSSHEHAEAGNLSQKMSGKEVISWVAIAPLMLILLGNFYIFGTSDLHQPLGNVSTRTWIALLLVSLFSAYIGNIFYYTPAYL